MIKQDEAKNLIQAEWHQWLRDNPQEMHSERNMIHFFAYLTKHRPDLLKFRCQGDPWQKVKSWLL